MRAPNSAFFTNVAQKLGAGGAGLGVAVAEGGDALDGRDGGAVEPRLLALVGRQQQARRGRARMPP